MQPPLLPVLMWLSHGVFKHGRAYTSVAENRGRSIIANPPWHFMRAQFYAIFVPIFFSLGIFVLVYVFCLKYFNWQVGVIATLLLVTSPIDIAIAPKLFADGLLSFFSFLSLFLFLKSLEFDSRHPFAWAAAAGISLAFCFYAKLPGILFAFSFLLAALLYPHPGSGFWKRVFDPRLIIAALVVFLFTSPWHWLVYKTYGTILPNTPQDPDNPWFRYVFNIPPSSYLIGILDFMPALLIGAIFGIFSLCRPRSYYLQATLMAMSLFYLGMFFLFIKTRTAGVEHRYLMPIHPLLAVLTGWSFVTITHLFKKPYQQSIAYLVMLSLLCILGWRSAELGLNYSFGGLANFMPSLPWKF
jgi:4-amino-4-deoxy-L-arabinose transferase-like glycosyltransferase